MQITDREYNKRKKAIEALSNDTMFYWQSYGYVGNCPNLWKKGSGGYTTEINDAELYTKEETLKQLACRRDQDTFWKEDDLRCAVIEVVDSQKIKGKSY